MHNFALLLIFVLEIRVHALFIADGNSEEKSSSLSANLNENINFIFPDATLEKRGFWRSSFRRVPNIDYSRPVNSLREQQVDLALRAYDYATKPLKLIECGVQLFTGLLDNGNVEWCERENLLGGEDAQMKHGLALGQLVDDGYLPPVVRNITDIDPRPIVAAARSKPSVRKTIIRYIVALQIQEDQRRSSGLCRLRSALSIPGDCEGRLSTTSRRIQVTPLTKRAPLPQQLSATIIPAPTTPVIDSGSAATDGPATEELVDDTVIEAGVYGIVGRYFSTEWDELSDSLDEPTKAISNTAWTTVIRTTTIPAIFEEDAPFTVSYVAPQQIQTTLSNDANPRDNASKWPLYAIAASIAFIVMLV
ncbi:hypothetical protein ABW21_db0202769 [Orbilia brochopaga]|nr:hypothetical protein ABW21_db0202769 [Drechslerella brochopaga]